MSQSIVAVQPPAVTQAPPTHRWPAKHAVAVGWQAPEAQVPVLAKLECPSEAQPAAPAAQALPLA